MGSIAIAFLYLLFHAREPLRLSIGDPWSDANVLTSINYVKSNGFMATSFTDILDVGPLTADSYRYIHYPPFSEIIYGAIGKYLGVSDIGTFRLFGLMFSSLAMWLMFSYARRMYTERIALIATALFSTSLMWMSYADSMHQAPVMQCSGWLALWGLVRAIETKQKRHYAAAVFGSFACFFTSYDYFMFLPAAVIATVWLKAGNPFAKGNRHFVVLCALGCAMGIAAKCLCVIGAVGWTEFVADLKLQFLERATATHDRKFTSTVPTMLRRLTLVFTPFAWIAAGYHAIKAIRAPSVSAAFKDTVIWMLLAALAFLNVFAQLSASQMLASQVLLPFYAFGSAIVIDRMFEARAGLRYAAWAWVIAAPMWGLFFMVTAPRAVLDRDDVAKTRAYLAEHDPNDFLLSNILSDGHIQASFDRHSWAALDAEDPSEAPIQMMRIFDLTGTDAVYEIISTDPDTRFIDKSLWPLAMPRGLWSVTGWPHLNPSKTRRVIREYDSRVIVNLERVHAEKVLQLSNYAVYRSDRATVMALLAAEVPTVDHIDFGSLTAKRHEIQGWASGPRVVEGTSLAATAIEGYWSCPEPRGPRGNVCKTKLTKTGVEVKNERPRQVAQLMIRVAPVCDLRMTFSLVGRSAVRYSINGFTAVPPPGASVSFVIPVAKLVQGINVVELENMAPQESGTTVYVSSLDLAPTCLAP